MNAVMVLIGKYLIGLLGISLVVIIHEIGHLIAAKACGITVEVFSFGLGPKIWGWNYKDTDFRISALPVGGYCRLRGSDDLTAALAHNASSFSHIQDGSVFSAHPFKRVVTYLSGPLANLLFAILLYALLASLPYALLTTEPLIAMVDDYPTLFAGATSPAHLQGLQTGDRVTHLNGESIQQWEDLQARLSESEGVQHVTVEREEKSLTFSVRGEVGEQGVRYGISPIRRPIVGSVRPATPEQDAGLQKDDRILQANKIAVANDLDLLVALASDMQKTELLVEREGNEVIITFRPDLDERGYGQWNFALASSHTEVASSPFSLKKGWDRALQITKDTLSSLLSLLQGKRKDVRQELTGAARAALMIGDITSLGLESSHASGLRALGYLLGVVSISLGVANILPLPAFDGGHIVTALFEWITGRRIRPKTYWILQLVGITIVVAVFLFLGFSDALHFLAIRR